MTERAPTRRREETRRRLVEAAYEVFSERGIRDTPVELICERAGFSRGAFYSNFTSKEDLFLALSHREFTARLDRVRAAVTAVAPAPDKGLHDTLAEAARVFMTALGEDKNWYLLALEFRIHGLRQDDLRPRIAAEQARLQAALAEVLADGFGRLGFRLVVPAAEAVRVLVALYEQALQEFLLSGEDEDRFFAPVMARVLGSLVTRVG
ncbi:AcrR family transcriptional regulator [Crossiella equi]|uniref:AcrR family transcriptional regulator n=1 Tax=Crossiella equi TaxID=130796 RepID=A0ABS5AR67_9PSEU|nr:TetR/AcrR family transcriptional regulator [Crossiella equi]MBP2478902.1 AcrR family transcriptional regulator [Crossiella equi]